MTDTPGNEPEQRLPAPVPEGTEVQVPVAPVERFSSTPATRSVELTPERAAQVVRQSSNARWVGFLAVVIVMLFVAIYWFYELGAPLGVSESRLDAEANAQSVTDVERGYNVYQANCARCHGANGEGLIGPALNRQDKLYQHLNANYISTVLSTGGRYVCGNPNSLMPIWSNQSTPPGPLNYRQIQEVISFIRSDKSVTYIKRDAEFFNPEIDPITGEVETFNGWVDTAYQPAPGSTPVSGLLDERVRGAVRFSGGVRFARGVGFAGAIRLGRSGRARRDGPGHRVPQHDAHRAREHELPDPLPERGRRDAPRHHDQGLDRRREVQGRDIPGQRDDDLRRAGAPGGNVSVRVLGALEHDRDPDRTVIDRRRGSAEEMGGRWRSRRSQPG